MAHKNTATTIDTLGPKLQGLGFEVNYASSVFNKPVRLLHMLIKTAFLKKKEHQKKIEKHFFLFIKLSETIPKNIIGILKYC